MFYVKTSKIHIEVVSITVPSSLEKLGKNKLNPISYNQEI